MRALQCGARRAEDDLLLAKRGVSSVPPPTRFDQYKTLTGLSTLRPEFAPYGVGVCRGTLQRLDEAFKGFFRRVKKGHRPGYPRFRSAKRFDASPGRM